MKAAAAIELLGFPYVEVSPPPPDSVIPYLAGGISMLAALMLGQGQQNVALELLEQSLERFSDHPDAEVQVQMAYARELIEGISDGT